MTYITKLNSFDEVAAHYAKTPVLKSKEHPVEQDIRPIGKRSRKWERIIKISKNCYVFSCGGAVDPVFNWGWSDKRPEFPITPKEIATLSPIVWRKHRDGSETITIRNGQGDWQHNSIYSFLSRALPVGLWFRINRQGRQAIYNRSEGKEYYLPKTKTVPRHIYESRRERAQRHESYKAQFAACMRDFDNLSLTFKRTKEGRFELVGEAPKEMVKRVRVEKDAKQLVKAEIAELYDWVAAMLPLMRSQLNYELRTSVSSQLDELAKTHKFDGYARSWGSLLGNCEPKLIRAILQDSQHPMRYALGIAAMFEVNDAVTPLERLRNNGRDYSDMSDEDFAKLLRTRTRATYTRWINRVAGFAKVIKEEK